MLSAEYVMASGSPRVMLCERGIRTFERATRATQDITAIAMAKRLSHLPVIVDPAHGTGKWYLVEALTLAGVAAGADGAMLEVHPEPDKALCDGPQSLTFENFENLMHKLAVMTEALGRPLRQAANRGGLNPKSPCQTAGWRFPAPSGSPARSPYPETNQ